MRNLQSEIVVPPPQTRLACAQWWHDWNSFFPISYSPIKAYPAIIAHDYARMQHSLMHLQRS
jgi:hypothetical protein